MTNIRPPCERPRNSGISCWPPPRRAIICCEAALTRPSRSWWPPKDQVKQQQALLQAEPALSERLAAWCARAERAQAAVFKAERERQRDNNPQTQAALEQARRDWDKVWNNSEREPSWQEEPEGRPAQGHAPPPLPPWLPALVGSAARPMGEEVRFLLALCKQEQAEREASREAWRAAADQWEAYLENYSSSWRAAVARGMHARALAALGDRKGAAALLQDLRGT